VLLTKRGLPLSRAVVNLLRKLIRVEDNSVSHVILLHSSLLFFKPLILYLNSQMNKLNSEKLKPGREEHYNWEYNTALSLSRSRYVLYLLSKL